MRVAGGVNRAVMFSRASDEWSTPPDLFQKLYEEFGFLLDAAASHDNHKGDEGTAYITAEGNALTADWFEWICGDDGDPRKVGLSLSVWCNPPYSKCREFVAKAAAERLRGLLTVMLLPARTDTRYFHEHLWDAETHRPRPGIELRFLKGRLKFGGSKKSAPFPSMLVVFRPSRRKR